MVKATLAVKHSKTKAKGTSRRSEEPRGNEVPVTSSTVLSTITVLGSVCLASPSPSEQVQGSSSRPPGHADVSAPLLLPIYPVVVSFGEAIHGVGGGSSQFGPASGAMVQSKLVPQPFGSMSFRKRFRDSSPCHPKGTTEVVKIGVFFLGMA